MCNKKNMSEKEMVKQLYLNTIIGKRSKFLRGYVSYSDYCEWVNKMAKHLLELGFSTQEMSFIVQQAEDKANILVKGNILGTKRD
ncbi:hypothetical protein [Alkalihalobacillus sp. BA299]|uniref:hypothetical protein n=1 Tax=Alkalihalobacillus sp. BA299 TaxID=2815938 RepID=UPI001ADCCC23|nr:hypothetical protein [Alkalihalobacillus sp. BA299]